MIDLHFVIAPDDQGQRLDHFLTQLDELPLSRSQIKKHLKDQEILVNGTPATKAGHPLRAGDIVQWQFTPHAPPSLHPQAIPLDILYEDDHVAIVDKPAGMVVHPSPGHADGTLVNALLHHFAHLSSTPPHAPTPRPGIVHRIDKDTSGALAVAKHNEAHQFLATLFATHDITRAYHALLWGKNLPEAGTFSTGHARDPGHRLRFTGSLPEGRRHAVTHWRVLERFAQDEIALVECRLETGRTHQIRMHFFDAGHPLLGDTLYGTKLTCPSRLIPRQALHAHTLGFVHLDGQTILAQAPYPADFAHALKELRAGKPWR